MHAEELLRNGQLLESLGKLEDEVRHNPADAQKRVFLFQLLSVLGQWKRALTQLSVAAELDSTNLLMAQMCREALQCEAFRSEVFSGKRLPHIFGEPEQWVGEVVQANQLTGQGHDKEAQQLRTQAFEAAPTVSGMIDDQPFEWIADADPRMGPVMEAIINGRYYWVPLFRVSQVIFDPPSDLRDMVWLPAQFTWTHGGEAVGLIPTRYPGSESSEDTQIQMARKTQWVERGTDMYIGLGQRMWATDQGEYPLLETKRIKFDVPGPQGQAEQSAGASDG